MRGTKAKLIRKAIGERSRSVKRAYNALPRPQRAALTPQAIRTLKP